MRGEGSTFKTGKGGWGFVHEMPPGEDGKRRQKRRTRDETTGRPFRYQRDAEAARERSYAAAWAVGATEAADKYLRAWLARREANLARGTVRNYRFMLDRYVVPYWQGRPVGQISAADVEDLYRRLREEAKIGPGTIHHVHRTLRAAFRDGVRKGSLARSPMPAVEPPKVPRTEIAALTVAEVAELREVIRGSRYECAAVVLTETGIRRGELLALRWSDVDLDRGRLSVQGSMEWVDKRRPIRSEPKTKSSLRTVSLWPSTVAAFREQGRRVARERLRAGPGWTDEGWCFPRPDGTGWAPHTFSTGWQRLLKRRGYERRVRVHDLRHTHASALIAKGWPLKVISARLGHASIQLTADLYGHLHPGHEEGLIERDVGLWSGGGEAEACRKSSGDR